MNSIWTHIIAYVAGLGILVGFLTNVRTIFTWILRKPEPKLAAFFIGQARSATHLALEIPDEVDRVGVRKYGVVIEVLNTGKLPAEDFQLRVYLPALSVFPERPMKTALNLPQMEARPTKSIKRKHYSEYVTEIHRVAYPDVAEAVAILSVWCQQPHSTNALWSIHWQHRRFPRFGYGSISVTFA